MSKIVVEGHVIETTEIFDIVDAGWRMHGFIIRMIGSTPDIEISEREKYDDYTHEKRSKNDRYNRLRQSIYEKWQSDKTDMPVFKL